MKVLVSAYACDPEAGSEPGAGWAWVRACALQHDTWVLTREKNRGPIERALAREPGLRLHPIYLDLPARWRGWKHRPGGVQAYYLLWQLLVRRVGGRLHATEQFDVGHHVTFAVDWMPAGLAWVPDLPVVWGPVGGTSASPTGLWRWLGCRGVIREGLREVGTRSMRRAFGDPTARRCRLVVAQNPDVLARFARIASTTVEPNVALDIPIPAEPSGLETSTRRAVFSGRLIPFKGLRLALATLNQPEAAGWSLSVFGDGPDRAPLERLTRKLDLVDRVEFLGHRPRPEVRRAVEAADVFLFPSLHDSAGWSVGEALIVGTPVVCLDRSGPAFLVSTGPGIAVANGRNLPGALAKALGDAPNVVCAEGVDRARRAWGVDRLPVVVDSLLRTAAGGVPEPNDVSRAAAEA
jgi:glycosyltransferase involved in cell wall biosynthesis